MANDNMYQNAVAATQAAVKADTTSSDRWVACGGAVAECFESEAALQEVKAQYIADAILPAIKPHHAKALRVELPRKGSKEYNDLNDADRQKWEIANQAKKDARATADTMFARVCKYAFPKEESESKSELEKLRLLIEKAIKKTEKVDCDRMAMQKNLGAALALLPKK